MTSTPMHHPDDDARPHSEDQGDESASTAGEGGDLVDEETKRLSREEAEQHDGIVDAQKDKIATEEDRPAQEGGYGY